MWCFIGWLASDVLLWGFSNVVIQIGGYWYTFGEYSQISFKRIASDILFGGFSHMVILYTF